MTTVGAIIVGAGRGERMGGQGGDKVFAALDRRPLLAYSVATFAASRVVQFIVVVLHERNLERGRALVQERRWRKVVAGCAGGGRPPDSLPAGARAPPPRAPPPVPPPPPALAPPP